MSDELFRQDRNHGGERAVVQGSDGPKQREKLDGPTIGVDFYKDRFERVDAVKREYSEGASNRTAMRRVPDYSSSEKLKSEIAEVAALGLMTWELPEWRPAQLSRDILKRLTDTVHQLKVVMKASDSLSEQVDVLYQARTQSSSSDESTAEETTEETKDE